MSSVLLMYGGTPRRFQTLLWAPYTWRRDSSMLLPSSGAHSPSTFVSTQHFYELHGVRKDIFTHLPVRSTHHPPLLHPVKTLLWAFSCTWRTETPCVFHTRGGGCFYCTVRLHTFMSSFLHVEKGFFHVSFVRVKNTITIHLHEHKTLSWALSDMLRS